MAVIHQFVAGFTNGDAISNEAMVMRDLFHSWGHQSEIFCELKRILPELRKQARDANDCQSSCKPDDVVILHLSIGSPVNSVFASLNCRKVILYHNVTPSHYFDMINKKTAYELARGRDQIKSLANTAQVNLADSQFNAGELTALGYKNVKVLPLILDTAKLKTAPDKKTTREFRDKKTNVLFVGRCAPNKKIEDALLAFAYFHKFVEPCSRFIHVGSFAGTERYFYLLKAMTKELDIVESVRFAGAVPQVQLNTFYQCADIFLCMSEHEGFCIPLIESMVHGVPIIAYNAAAVPETLDGSGIIFLEKQYPMIAEMMGRLVHDTALKNAVIEAQNTRLKRYVARDLNSELKAHLMPLISQTR